MKSKFSPSGSPNARFPYQRKARSISPPKEEDLVFPELSERFFPIGSPVIPDNSLQGDLPDVSGSEDEDFLNLKQQYLNLIQQAPGLDFKSKLFEEEDCDTEEFSKWELSIMDKMKLH